MTTTARGAARPASTGTRRRRSFSPARGRPNPLATLVLGAFLAYVLVPLVWLVMSATKTDGDLFSTFGFAPGHEFVLLDNIQDVFTAEHGIFLLWMRNTLLYSLAAAAGAALTSTLAGYAFAMFRFKGRTLIAGIILVTIMVPQTALAVPLFRVMREAGLVNTPFAVILPSVVSPFGVYLMWRYIEQSFPRDVLDAARVDGAGELRIVSSVAVPIVAPAIATVFLFVCVATWNNFLLPLLVLTDRDLQTLTVGLAAWNTQNMQAGNIEPVFTRVITAALISILPLIAAFFLLQRYWRSGLTAGAVQ